MSMVNEKVSSKIKNERSLYWNLILYPDEDISHKNALEYIQHHYSYAYIIHNKDIDQNGELKKPHVHCVIKFNNYRWKNAISEELNIPSNYLQKCNNLKSSLEYLIHFNEDDKTHYNINEVFGDLKIKLEYYLQDRNITESEKVLQLIDFIDSYDDNLSVKDFIIFCCHKNMYDIYRRNAYSFNKILEEHNFQIFKKNQFYN